MFFPGWDPMVHSLTLTWHQPVSRLQAMQAEATGFGSLEATRKAECQVKGMDGKMEILEPKMMTKFPK